MPISTRALLFASTLVLLAAGCEKRFVPSERMKAIEAKLDPVDAARFLAEAVRGTPSGFGLCKAPFRWGDLKATIGDRERLAIPALKAGPGGVDESYGEARPFRQLKKIRFSEDATGFCQVTVPAGRAAIALYDGGSPVPVVIAVGKAELYALLGALAVLAPDAPQYQARRP